MENHQTVMSSKGQVVIPKSLRQTLGLGPGQPFILKATDEGILLKPLTQDFPETSLDEVAGCLAREGRKTVSIDEMGAAIRRGIEERDK